MKKSYNGSVNRIMNYIDNNKNITPVEKRMLLNYAAQLYINKVENIQNEKIELILKDIKYLNNHLKESDDTSIVRSKLDDEIKIFELLNDYYKNNQLHLEEISFLLDKLYLDTDLKIRSNSSLSYNLEKKLKKEEIR